MNEQDTHRLKHAVIREVFPDMTEEETREWKIKKKSNYSKPFKTKTIAELQDEFPTGRIYEGKFSVDTEDSTGELVRKIFDERGHEIERASYKPDAKIGEEATDKSFYRRITSEYDEEGYLVGVLVMKTNDGKHKVGGIDMTGFEVGGYISRIEYETINGNIKVPKQLITQEVLPLTGDYSLRKPGFTIGYRPPSVIDFTDVPFVPPES